MASAKNHIGNDVCVIGAGAFGLVTAKNLHERGLSVTVFDKNEYIGGLWHASPNTSHTTALPGTTKNTSKQTSSFTDFPYPAEARTHPTAKQVGDYLYAYAEHFGIKPFIKLSTKVTKVERDELKGKWTVYTEDARLGPDAPVQARTFDRIVVASGQLNVPNMPKFKGSEKFAGDILQSRDFKDPSKYEGKRVIVVGVGASGADTQSFLKKANAKKVFLSHRGQIMMLPRMLDGKAFDHTMTRRVGNLLRFLSGLWPGTTLKLLSAGLAGARKKAFPSLTNHPSFGPPRVWDGLPHRIPMFSDDLPDNFNSGIVEAVMGIQEISSPRSVTLTDGAVLDDIDAIIVCSGYHYDFSVVQGPGNPTDPARMPDGYSRYKTARYYDQQNPFPRLYRGFLSEEYPESLAFIGHMHIMKPPFVVNDLVTMALASLWTGAYPLPTAAQMDRDISGQYDFVVKYLNHGPVPHPGFRLSLTGQTYRWLNEVGGTGVEQLGSWGLDGWKLWFKDRRLYSLLMDGVDTPFIYRLFNTDRGRKPWSGARQQIEKANKEVEAMTEAWKKDKAVKQT